MLSDILLETCSSKCSIATLSTQLNRELRTQASITPSSSRSTRPQNCQQPGTSQTFYVIRTHGQINFVNRFHYCPNSVRYNQSCLYVYPRDALLTRYYLRPCFCLRLSVTSRESYCIEMNNKLNNNNLIISKRLDDPSWFSREGFLQSYYKDFRAFTK